MPDPGAISASDWLQIGKWLTRLWVYFFFIVAFAFTFLTAHAVIPSLVASGQLPQQAVKLRPLMYGGCLLLLAGAGVFMNWTFDKSHLLEQFWGRFWI